MTVSTEIERSDVLFEYSGQLSEPVIANLAQALRMRIGRCGVANVRARKIFSAAMEMAYNVVHHGRPESAEPAEVRTGHITVRQIADHYEVSCGNRIRRKDADLLAARIDELRAMSPEVLRAEYHTRLTQLEQESPEGAGAGLGLLIVARDASRPLEYSLDDDDSDGDACIFDLHAFV